MLTVRPSGERGHFDHGWLDTRHTFSFGAYRDPAWDQFSVLRVMNEDRVAPGAGFPMHGHRDMEIISYVLDGALEHRDNLGNGSVLRPGTFQRMSAGKGVLHSEFNHESDAVTHFYQIWLLPSETGGPATYEERTFDPASRRGRLQLVAGPDGGGEALTIRQDARVYLADLASTDQVSLNLAAERSGWIQVLRGAIVMHGARFGAGDGVGVRDTPTVAIAGAAPQSEVMVFDLP